MFRRQNRRLEVFMLKMDSGGFTPVFMFSTDDKTIIPALILDISLGGCRIMLPKKHGRIGSPIRLRLQKADQTAGEMTEVDVVQRWVNQDYSIEHMTVGLQFVDARRQQDKIERLIDGFLRLKAADPYLRAELIPVQENAA